ncbi:hypothetical protein P9112_014106 [Eukaryota sp. TZLM1-RC]
MLPALENALETAIARLSLHQSERLRLVSQSFSRLVRRSSRKRVSLDLVPIAPIPSHLPSIFSHYPFLKTLKLHWSFEFGSDADLKNSLDACKILRNLNHLYLPITDLSISSPSPVLSRVDSIYHSKNKIPVFVFSSILEQLSRSYPKINFAMINTDVDQHFVNAINSGKFINLQSLFIKNLLIPAKSLISILENLPKLKTIIFHNTANTVSSLLFNLSCTVPHIRFECIPMNNEAEANPVLMETRLLSKYTSITGLQFSQAASCCPCLEKFYGPFDSPLVCSTPLTLRTAIVKINKNYEKRFREFCYMMASLPLLTSVGVNIRTEKCCSLFFKLLPSCIINLELYLKTSNLTSLQSIPLLCPLLESLILSGKDMVLDALPWSQMAFVQRLNKLERLVLEHVYFDDTVCIFKCPMWSLRYLSISQFTTHRGKMPLSFPELLENSPYLIDFYIDVYFYGLIKHLAQHNKRLTRFWTEEVIEEGELRELDSIFTVLVRPRGYHKTDLLSGGH